VNIVLNRRAALPLGEQLVSQVELCILSGELEQGRRLPSVRAMARRLDVHPRTVHAAYKKLNEAGHLELEPGSGAYVARGTKRPGGSAARRPLEEALRMALRSAVEAGYRAEEIRATVRAWLENPPPERLVVADPARETAELLVEELRVLGEMELVARNLGEAAAELRAGAAVLTLPFHADRLRRTVSGAPVITATLAIAAAHREALLRVPAGGVVLAVSHSPRVLTYARAWLQSLRGHDVVVECHALKSRRHWQRLAPVADLTLADVLSWPTVQPLTANGSELRLLSPRAVEEVRCVMTLPVVGTARGRRAPRLRRVTGL
jgi:DNA-binding transcriptional regulator YhcF (GntR family)